MGTPATQLKANRLASSGPQISQPRLSLAEYELKEASPPPSISGGPVSGTRLKSVAETVKVTRLPPVDRKDTSRRSRAPIYARDLSLNQVAEDAHPTVQDEEDLRNADIDSLRAIREEVGRELTLADLDFDDDGTAVVQRTLPPEAILPPRIRTLVRDMIDGEPTLRTVPPID